MVFIFPEGSESGTTYLAPETAFTFVLQAMHLERVSSGELFPTAVTLKGFNACGRESANTFTQRAGKTLPECYSRHSKALFEEEILC